MSSYYVANLYYKIHNREIKTKNKLATSEFRSNRFYFSQILLARCHQIGKGDYFLEMSAQCMHLEQIQSFRGFSWCFFFTSLYKKFIMSPCVSICYICSSTATFLLFARGVYGHLLHMYTKNVKDS